MGTVFEIEDGVSFAEYQVQRWSIRRISNGAMDKVFVDCALK